MHRPGFLILSMMCTYTENSSIQKKNLEILVTYNKDVSICKVELAKIETIFKEIMAEHFQISWKETNP